MLRRQQGVKEKKIGRNNSLKDLTAKISLQPVEGTTVEQVSTLQLVEMTNNNSGL